MGLKHLTIDLTGRFTNGNIDKNMVLPSKRRILPFKLHKDKTILIEGTFRVIRITLSKMKRSLFTIDNTDPDINKNDKALIFENWEIKMANLQKGVEKIAKQNF